MSTYTELRNAVDEAAEGTTSQTERLRRSRSFVQDIEYNLQALQEDFGPLFAEINSKADANPTDEQWQSLKGEKGKIQSDFLSLKSKAADIGTAIDTVGLP